MHALLRCCTDEIDAILFRFRLLVVVVAAAAAAALFDAVAAVRRTEVGAVA